MKTGKISSKWLLLALFPLMGQGCWGCFGSFTPPPVEPMDSLPPAFQVSPQSLSLRHIRGESSCPDKFEPVQLTGPDGGQWTIPNIDDKPGWLEFNTQSGTFPATLQPTFTCRDYQEEQSWTVKLSDGTEIKDFKIGLKIDY